MGLVKDGRMLDLQIYNQHKLYSKSFVIDFALQEMASTARLYILKSLLYIVAVILLLDSGNAQTCSSVEQPVVSSLDPPSGTTGTDESLSTLYTITGERLDQVVDIIVELDLSLERIQLASMMIIDERTVTFRLSVNPPLPSRSGGNPARVRIIPANSSCSTVELTISLHDTIVLSLAVVLQAQPGTTIATARGTCLPSSCGDNNTMYEVIVGGVSLELLETTRISFVARFPEFITTNDAADVVISTQYQMFTLAVSTRFALFVQTSNAVVTPSRGQRGTRIVITGSNLLGRGTFISLSQVTIGGMTAEIVSSSDNMIELSANSGSPGIVSISINTTQNINSIDYDGPYTFLENIWTHLDDGFISHIIPPAVQEGGNVTLCGSRLLGGGLTISEVSLAGISSSVVSATPFAFSGLPGNECITVEVPSSTGISTTGVVDVVADTGALVQSTTNFTFAEIQEVIPSRGQPGTIVTIRGTALLSGYVMPTTTVMLNGVMATIMSLSDSEIIVRAAEPVNDTINGLQGAVIISVEDLFDDRHSVSSTIQTWTYEPPGQIANVSPTFGQFGTLLTITGSNLFAYGASIDRATVGGLDATLVESTDTLVTLRASDGIPSIADIVLFSDNGAEVRGVDVFEFRVRGSISQILPNEGQSGTFVSISGMNLFGYGNNITSVMFGNTPAIIDHAQSLNTSIRVRIQTNTDIVQNTPVVVTITSDTSSIVESAPIWTYLVQGMVNDIQPPTGQDGTRVTLTGTNLLGGGGAAIQVLVDGVETIISSSSDTRIDVIMGSIDTRIITATPSQAFIMADTGAIVLGGNYTHRSSGIIDSFSPTTGREGTMVIVLGQNLLGYGDSITLITVAGIIATINSFDNSQIIIVVGPGLDLDEGPIQLTINTGATITSTTNFTYEQSGSISDISPDEGAEGIGVLIRGSALFPSNAQLTSVTIGGNSVSRIVTSTVTEISVIVGTAPTVNPMLAEIEITASDGSFVSGMFFRFVELSISLPGVTSGREGTQIDIIVPASPQFDVAVGLTATIDDEYAEIVSLITGNRITVRVPRAKRAGMFMADVAIENPQRLVARLPNSFTYLPEGAIYSITPTVGQKGTRVVMEGEHLLGGGTTIDSAMLAGVSANVVLSSDESVTVEIVDNPATSTLFPSTGDILLTGNTGAIARRLNGFALVRPGVILSVSPASGQVGTLVAITGTDLLQGSEEVQQVTIAGVQADLEGTASNSLITVAAASSNLQSGPVEITLVTGAVITSTMQFEYLQEGQIDRLEPNSGTTGTRVTIRGTNLLGGGMNVERVLLAGVEAIVQSFTDETITVIAQAGGPDTIGGDVEIIINTGARIIELFFWTYRELGSISNIEPSVGQRGIDVTLRGMRLLGSTGITVEQCILAGIPADVIMFTRTTVVCRAGFFPDLVSMPANGTGPAEIITNLGVVVTSDINTTFTYYIAEIDTVTPSTGNNGTIVQISGINLLGFPGDGSTIDSVMFGNIPATVVTSTNNDITIRVGLSPIATQNDFVRVTSSVGSFLELENAWNYSPPGQMDSITPSTAFSGDTISIIGMNLFPPLAIDNGVMVIVGQTRSSQARIINSSYIEFVAGVYQSTDNAGEQLPVQIVYNTGEIVYNPQITFTYNATPGIVESVFPIAGFENTVVTISGRNLIGDLNITQVYLAGIPVNRILDNATNDEIVVVAGAGPADGQFGTIVIETNDGRQFGLAGNAWRYYPIVSSGAVLPSSGQNGTVVTINLPGDAPYPIVENVTFSGYPVIDFSFALGTLTVTVQTDATNPSSPVTGNVVINFLDSTQLIIVNAWTYLDPVQISSISPENMQGYFNSVVTINGENFQAGRGLTVTNVYLASIETTIISQTDTELQVQITEQRNSTSQALVGPIVIVSQDSATYTSELPFSFTYVQVRVYSVGPQQGQRGTRVSINGTGLLLGGSSVDSILFGNVSATIITATDFEIVASAGDSLMQTNVSDISYRVDTRADYTIPDSWRYIVPGEITSVSPDEGGMGTIVTISGTNLFGGGDRAETVLLNNVPVQSIVTNFDNLIQVVAGQTATALSPGNVQVISNTGAVTESSSNVAYTYLTPGRVMNAMPQIGQNGTRVTIDGSFFHNGEGISRILLAGVEATIEMRIVDSLSSGFPSTFLVRAGRPSAPHSFSGPVTMISHFNTMSVSDFNFTYISEGAIFSVTPDQGQTGTQVTIRGENLLGGGSSIQAVFLAGIQAAFTQVVPTDDAVQVSANMSTNPIPGAQLGDVVLISDTGAYVRRVDGWSYVEEGTVTDIQPRQGQWGTMVTITGQRLLSGGNSVSGALMDDVIMLSVISSTSTSIIARVGQPDSPVSFYTSDITLISNFGGILFQDIEWLFLNQSSIDAVVPPSGFGNTLVEVIGTNLLGGGTQISSASLVSIPAENILSNDTAVQFNAGFNANGQQMTGDVRLESDTGAITVVVNGWEYRNECPQGQFGNSFNCQPCDPECLTCDGPNSTDCFTCRNFALELGNSTDNVQCVPSCANVSTLGELRFCRDACELDEYRRVGVENGTAGIFCYQCNTQCDRNLSCSGPSATECGGCANVFNSQNQTCIDECPIGTYKDELRRCVPCDSQCAIENGCVGPNSTDCRNCSNVFVSITLMDGISQDSCLENCPRLYLLQGESNLCAPCNNQCLEGCSGLSPFDCVNCTGASFVFPNGRKKCVATCNPDPTRLTFYEDSVRVCQPCSNVCSLTGGCDGPTAFDCKGCRLIPGSNNSIPLLNGECLNACPNVNNSYTFYADDNTNECEICHSTCEIGCTGPLSIDCIPSRSALAAEGGAIALFIIVLAIVLIVLVVLVVYIVHQRKRGYSYKVDEGGDDTIELGYRDTRITSLEDGEGAIANRGAEVIPAAEAMNEANSNSLKKSDRNSGLLYNDMQSEPRYSVPTPKSERKTAKSEEPPPLPVTYKPATKDSKPPPPIPPSPSAHLEDDDVYEGMDANVQEVLMNPGAVADEEYSIMAPAPIEHNNTHIDEIYDDAESMPTSSSSGPAPLPPKPDDKTPLLDEDLYEDTETAVAQAVEYKRISRDEPIRDSKRFSGVFDKPPELPSRPVPKKRSATPLPETPLQKSLSSASFSPTSPVHQPPAVADDDIYIEPMGGPIEESLYEELPTAGEFSPAIESEYNEIPLPPRPKK